MAKQAWLDQRERGNAGLAQAVIWLATLGGRGIARAVLLPVCVYYFVVLREPRKAIVTFLRRVTGTEGDSSRAVIRQYFNFATTLLDRIYALRGDWGRLDVQVRGSDVLAKLHREQRSCILLGSHHGSFEIARASALTTGPLKLQVVMHEVNAELAHTLTQKLNPEFAATVIAAGQPDTMLRVKDALERGEMVGILGDRALDNRRSCHCDFFSFPARFPTAPLRLAAMLSVPVVLFFGLYRGGNRYELHFELFADAHALAATTDPAVLESWVQRYVRRLEHYCRMAPDNWFNFYDIWATER